MRQRWCEPLAYLTGDGPSLSNSLTATSLLNSGDKGYIIPSWLEVGTMIRITFAGRLSNIVTTPGTLTLDVRFVGGSTVVVFNGGAMQLSTTAHTTLPIYGEILLTCRAKGTSANFMGQGRVSSQCLSLTAVADSTTTPATLLMPNTTPAVGTNFDSTVGQLVDFFATFSIQNAGNLLQLHQYLVETVS